jgi:ribosomal-protein-alanine N-acetyltransferase
MRKPTVQDHPENQIESLTDDLRVEIMQPEDVDEVMRIERASFSAPWARGYFVQEIRRNPLAYLYVLRDHRTGGIRAYIDLWLLRKQAHINNIAVAPDARNRGFGEMLMRHSMEMARQQGCKRAVLEVRVSNEPARRLYSKLGFHVAGELPGYYSDGENAYVLIAEIRGDT